MDGSELQTKPAVAVQKPLPDLEGSYNTDVVADGRALVVPDRAKPIDATQLELPEASPTLYIPSDTIVLGEELDEQGRKTGKQVTLGIEELYAGGHIMGLMRHGKTGLGINAFLQLAEKGYGAAYIDPHSEAIGEILERLPLQRVEDVIILDVTRDHDAFGMNPLHCADPSSDVAITYAYAPVFELFTRLYAEAETGQMGIWLQKFISNSIYALLEHPGHTLLDILRLLTDKAFREVVAGSLRNKEVTDFFLSEFPSLSLHQQAEEIRSTKTRLNLILQNPIIKSIIGHATLNFRTIMDTKKLMLISFPVELPVDFRTMLGTMLIAELQTAMFSRKDTPKENRVPFFLIADEIQEVATQSFHKFIEQGGKFRVGTIVLHQSLHQPGMDNATRNAVLTAANKIYVRVNDADADTVSPGFAKESVDDAWVIPNDVLGGLKNHERIEIRDFYELDIAPFFEALDQPEQKRYQHDTYMTLSGEHINKEIPVLPSWNFGAGEMEFEPKEAYQMCRLCNTLLRETQLHRASPQHMSEIRQWVIHDIAPYRKYITWYAGFYLNKWPDITPRLNEAKQEAVDRIAKLKERVAELDAILQSTDTLVAHLFPYSFDLKKEGRLTLEESWEELRQKTANHKKWAYTDGTYEGIYEKTYYKGLERRLAELREKRDELLEKTNIPLELKLSLWYEKIAWGLYGKTCPDIDRLEYDRQMLKEAERDIAEAEHALRSGSEDAVFAFFVTHNEYGKKEMSDAAIKEAVEAKRKEILDQLSRSSERIAEYRSTDTPEKLLAAKRKPLEEERDSLHRQIEFIPIGLEKELASIKKYHEDYLAGEKTRHDRFVNRLDTVLRLLMQPENYVKVRAGNRLLDREKTVHEMADLAAYELRNLPKYTALCKLVEDATHQTVVYKVALAPLPAPHPTGIVETLTKRIWERMEKDYYRPKATIMAEIANRHKLPASASRAFVTLPNKTKEKVVASNAPH